MSEEVYNFALTRSQHMALVAILGAAMEANQTYVDCSENPEGIETSAADLYRAAMDITPEVRGKKKPLDRNFMREISEGVKAKLPDNWGFLLLAFTFGPKGQLVYSSNARREDAIATLKEFLLKAGAAEDWMKHL